MGRHRPLAARGLCGRCDTCVSLKSSRNSQVAVKQWGLETGRQPPGTSPGGVSRAWPAALPLALRAGEEAAGRGLEGPEKDQRGRFKGQACVSAWPEAQGSPTGFQELQVLPSTEHARPGGLETISGSVGLGFLEGEEPSLEGGAPAPWGELECAALFEKSCCLLVWRPLGPDSAAVGFVSFLSSTCFPLVVAITSSWLRTRGRVCAQGVTSFLAHQGKPSY